MDIYIIDHSTTEGNYEIGFSQKDRASDEEICKALGLAQYEFYTLALKCNAAFTTVDMDGRRVTYACFAQYANAEQFRSLLLQKLNEKNVDEKELEKRTYEFLDQVFGRNSEHADLAEKIKDRYHLAECDDIGVDDLCEGTKHSILLDMFTQSDDAIAQWCSENLSGDDCVRIGRKISGDDSSEQLVEKWLHAASNEDVAEKIRYCMTYNGYRDLAERLLDLDDAIDDVIERVEETDLIRAIRDKYDLHEFIKDCIDELV